MFTVLLCFMKLPESAVLKFGICKFSRDLNGSKFLQDRMLQYRLFSNNMAADDKRTINSDP